MNTDELRKKAQEALDAGDLEAARGFISQLKENKQTEETAAQLKQELENDLQEIGDSDEPKAKEPEPTKPEDEPKDPVDPEKAPEPTKSDKPTEPALPVEDDEDKKKKAKKGEIRSMPVEEVVLNPKKEEEIRSIEAFIRSKGMERRDGLTTVGAEAVIPIDRITKPESQPETVVDLRKLVGRVPVKTGTGSYPILLANKDILISVEELAKNPALANPQFKKVDYKIATYRGYIPISQEAVDDSDVDLSGIVAAHIDRQSLNTSNKAIATVLKKAPAKEMKTLDDLKTIVNVAIDPAYAVKFIVSQSFFNAVDQLKDNEGRYLLQQDITVQSGYKLFGREVVVLADKVIGDNDGDEVAFVGDASLFAKFFDRKQASVRWVDNDVYGQLLAGFVRFDVEVADTEAGYYVTLGKGVTSTTSTTEKPEETTTTTTTKA